MEEQAEEIDILQSIYPDEIEVYTPTSYVVHLTLDTLPPQGIAVDVDYPPTYPAEDTPVLKLTTFPVEYEKEVSYRYDLDAQDIEQLSEQAKEWAQENIGMPSVFTVISQLKDAAEELHAKRVSDREAAHLKELQIQEEKEQAKFKGTKVTPESFAAWRAEFRKEMGWDQPKRETGALTGKEIFERGIAKDADDVADEA